MATLSTHTPVAARAIVAKFHHRDQADEAVEVLTRSGFGTDQICVITPSDYGIFGPGRSAVAIEPCGFDEFVRMILRDHGADEIAFAKVGPAEEAQEPDRLEAAR